MKRVFEQIEEAFSELERNLQTKIKHLTNKRKINKLTLNVFIRIKNLKKKSKKSVPEELERSARQRGRVEEKHVNLPIHARAIETRINFKKN